MCDADIDLHSDDARETILRVDNHNTFENHDCS